MKLASTRNLRSVADAKRCKRREELIATVQRGLDMTGAALEELRDDEHWKDTGHTTFADFCRATFNISKTKLYTILRRLEVTSSLPKHLQSSITSDAQVIALSKLPVEKRAEVVEKAIQNGGLTAESIALYAANPVTESVPKPKSTKPTTEFRTRNSPVSEPQPVTNEKPKTPVPKKDKKVELDKVGTPIPDDALPYWNRRQEVQDILTEISRIKSHVLGAREANDPMWMKVPNHIQDTFSAMRIQIMEAYPYAVCTTCMGSPSLQPTGCAFCGNKGLISQFQWERQSDSRIKEIRMKSNVDYAKEHNLPLPTVTV